jgi:hypothetical protein
MNLVGERTSFCTHCEKTVHDLRGHSLISVVSFVKANPSACIIVGKARAEASQSEDSNKPELSE